MAKAATYQGAVRSSLGFSFKDGGNAEVGKGLNVPGE